MEKIQLKAVKRTEKNANKIRKQGMVPAVLYGYKVENASLAVNAIEFEKAFRKAGESTLVELTTEDGKTTPVLIHDVQNDVIKSHPIHVDFFAVNMTEKLKTNVSLEFVGESNAVKAMGGTLVKVLSEVEVESLPTDLPHSIQVDISSLATFDDTILVKDLKVPAKVEITTDPEETVAMVQPPRDVEAELAAPVEENVEAVVAASTPATEGAEGTEEAAE